MAPAPAPTQVERAHNSPLMDLKKVLQVEGHLQLQTPVWVNPGCGGVLSAYVESDMPIQLTLRGVDEREHPVRNGKEGDDQYRSQSS